MHTSIDLRAFAMILGLTLAVWPRDRDIAALHSGDAHVATRFEIHVAASVHPAHGPYGDAIVEEMLPYIEEHFRTVRK